MLRNVRVVQRLLKTQPAKQFSDNFLSANNALYAESMYQKWIEDPKSVHSSWDSYFRNITNGIPSEHAFIHPDQISKLQASINFRSVQADSGSSSTVLFQKISNLVQNFRKKGHYLAKVNPLDLKYGTPPLKDDINCLTLEENGISKAEENIKVDLSALNAKGFTSSKKEWTALEVFEHLKTIYCGKVAFQYTHIQNQEVLDWIRERVEKEPKFEFTKAAKLNLFERIVESQAFSLFCEKRYSTYKRFGCDGLDSGISALGNLVQAASHYQVKETIMGMAHRGRLNVLCCVLKKPYEQMFAEFEDIRYLNERDIIYGFSGDVKYHIGCSNKIKFDSNSEMILNLLPNPSHLEAVNPVVIGSTRARQTKLDDESGDKVLPVLIHGDAALSGQGIIYETQQMEKLKDYSVGGTIHLVFNNQIGFTTDQFQGRSSFYPTNIAKVNNNFVIHVNAHEPEYVDWAIQLAVDFRMKFKSDVFVNLIGYRKYGHNEQDTPTFTQPQMYSLIANKKPMYLCYAEQLVKEGVISETYLQERIDFYTAELDKSQKIAKGDNFNAEEWDHYGWKEVLKSDREQTGIDKETFQKIGQTINNVPADMNIHRSIKKIYEDRLKSITDGIGVDWATAESLAFASLLHEGHSVRLSGEDVERGTFSHRHAVITDQVSNAKFTPLRQIFENNKTDSKLVIVNSLLSEYGVLGFEYGHSIAQPDDLTIWEAQFGDFVNGAQIIVDQFVASGEKKWGKMNGLVMLLPHGYDGQGPEHSNPRLERLLAAVSDDYYEVEEKGFNESQSTNINAFVCNVTNPANYFHLLRRQLKRNYRKPLFVLSPKRLLRHKLVRSNVEEFLNTSEFKKVYDDSTIADKNAVRRVILCSGQIYFDLLERKEKEQANNVALVRLEQLGPFPYWEFENVMKTYSKSADMMFVSEEHLNFGAWGFVQPRADLILKKLGFEPLSFVGRPVSSAPATGSSSKHKAELSELLTNAFK